MSDRPTLAGVSSGLIEAIVLAAVVTTPLFFNPRTERIFEPDKLAWLICLAACAAWAGWAHLCATFDGQRLPLPLPLPPRGARPLFGVVLALAVALAVSTALSIAPAISLWGSYRRGQGLFAVLALMVLFGATVHAARRAAARRRILGLACAASVPAALYGLLQRFSIDTIPWSQYGDAADVRAFGPLGNAIFLGAYVSMIVPIALGLAFDGGRRIARPRGRYLAVAAVALAGLLASASRGPVIGLAAGLAAGALLAAADAGRRRLALGALAGGVGLVGLLVALGRAGVPGLERFGTLLAVGSRTAQERLLAWDALARAAADDPARRLYGHGIETLTFLLPPFADVQLARLTPTQVFDRAHNVVWEWWVAAGVVGVVAYLALYAAAFHIGRGLLGWASAIRAPSGEPGTPATSAVSASSWAFAGIAAAGLGVAALASAAVWPLRPGLIGLAATLGAVAGMVGFVVGARLIETGRGAPPAAGVVPPRPWWVIGVLAALVAHLVEGALGVPTIVGELLFWVLLGVLAGAAIESAAQPTAPPSAAPPSTAPLATALAEPAAAAVATGLIVGLGLAAVTFAPLVLPFGLGAVFDGANVLLLGLPIGLWVCADLVAGPLGAVSGPPGATEGGSMAKAKAKAKADPKAKAGARAKARAGAKAGSGAGEARRTRAGGGSMDRTGGGIWAGRRAAARLAVLGGALLLLLPLRAYAAGPTAAFGLVLMVATLAAGWLLAAAARESESSAGAPVSSRAVASESSERGAPAGVGESWRLVFALAGVPLAAVVAWTVGLRPVIADAQLPAGLDAAARGDVAAAGERFAAAARLWPWQPNYAHYTAAFDRDVFVSDDVAPAERLAAFARAEATLERAFAMHPSEALARRRAMLHRDRADRASDAAARRADVDAAARWFEEALRRDPNAPESHAEYAQLLERMELPGAAREHFSRALDINPNRIDWWIGLARAALAEGDVAAAGAAIGDAAGRVPPERIDELLSALAAEADGLPIPPYEPLWSLRVRALVEARTGRREAAAATLDELQRRAPSDGRIEALRAAIAAGGGAD